MMISLDINVELDLPQDRSLLHRVENPPNYALFHEIKNPGRCEHCGESEGIKAVPAMTSYGIEHLVPKTRWDRLRSAFIEKPEDPNRNQYLCPDCTEEHVSYWNEMWDEYYRGLG